MKKINKLKQTPRIGWLESRIPIDEAEDVAQHSFETVSITLLLGDLSDKNIDLEKALKMATLHDWAEAITGDFSKELTEQIGAEKKKEIEESVLENLFEDENISQKEEYLDLWRDYSEEESIEAILVKIADKLSILLEVSKLLKQGKDSEKLKEIRKKTRDSLNPYIPDFPFLETILHDLDEDFSDLTARS